MTTAGYGLRVDRTLVQGKSVPTVQITLRSEVDEPIRYRLNERIVGKTFTGIIPSNQTEVFEYLVPEAAATEVELLNAPVEVTLFPIGTAVSTDGGREENGPFTVDRPDMGDKLSSANCTAIGVVLTADNADTAARTVSRAVERGYQVYVAHARDTDAEPLEFIEHLGGELVTLDRPTADTTGLQRGLIVAARVDECSGIILSDGDKPVDFGASRASLATSGGFATQAVSKSEPETTELTDAAPTDGCVVGIPAFNEASTIGAVVREARQYADAVVVVDDGSTDGTAEAAEAAGARVVSHGENRGYGAALRSVFTEAARQGADTLTIVDADGQHDVSDILPLLRARHETDADLVIGSRFVEGATTDMPAYRRFGVEVVNVLTNAAVGRLTSGYIRDTQSGFRVYGRRAIETLATDTSIGDGMNASTDIIFHVADHDYRIVETPISVRYDVENANTHNPITHGLHLVGNIASHTVRRRPTVAIGVPSGLLIFLGLLLGYVALVGTAQLSSVPLGLENISAVLLCFGLVWTMAGLALRAAGGRQA